MTAFFASTPEARLNRAFICRSGVCENNGAMTAPRPRTLGFGGRVVLAVVVLLGLAQHDGRASDRDDHDRARAAVLAGEVLPLQTLLERLQRSRPGQVLELELEREDGRWVYEIRLLQFDG